MLVTRWPLTALAFFLAVTVFSIDGTAQSCTQNVYCEVTSENSGCVPTLPATAYGCKTIMPLEAECTVKTASCAPSPCTNCPSAGNPISLATGNTFITQTDVSIPGLGGGLALVRTWNSTSFSVGGIDSGGRFGSSWRSTYEERIFAFSDGYVKYVRGDGSFWSFGFTGQQDTTNFYAVAGPANQTATLAQNTTTWALTLKNGEQRTFDLNTGSLLSISDRNGNTTQLTYDSSNRLTTVADPGGRHLYFSYADPSSPLVTSVSSDVGVSVGYSYDARGRLATVTKPDNTTVSFQYLDDYSTLITAVLDSSGKILESHSYNECRQGVTSSRAGGVDAITVAVPKSCGLAIP